MDIKLVISRTGLQAVTDILANKGFVLKERNSRYGWEGTNVFFECEKVGRIEPYRNEAYPLSLNLDVRRVLPSILADIIRDACIKADAIDEEKPEA